MDEKIEMLEVRLPMAMPDERIRRYYQIQEQTIKTLLASDKSELLLKIISDWMDGLQDWDLIRFHIREPQNIYETLYSKPMLVTKTVLQSVRERWGFTPPQREFPDQEKSV